MKGEMNAKLKYKTKPVQVGLNNNKRKLKKQWWNEQLTDLWNDTCLAEKRMLKSHCVRRNVLSKEFKDKRKLFDRAVQMAKRKSLKEQQLELENLITTDQNSFWKKIGKIGKGQERRRDIPMEILLDNGTVCKDIDMVLEKWKSSYENLLNPVGEVTCPNNVNRLVPIESNPVGHKCLNYTRGGRKSYERNEKP